MGIKEKRAQQKEAFRMEILDAARELFINDGYEKFSMRKLAKKIDYSPTTIYIYYNNKDDLLFAICEEYAKQFLNRLSQIRAASKDPLKALRKALLYFTEFGISNPNQFKVFFFTKPDVYGTREEFMKKESMARSTYLIFRAIVKDCIDAGRLKKMDVEVLTQALGVVPHGLIVKAIYNSSFPIADNNVVAHALVNALLKGFQI